MTAALTRTVSFGRAEEGAAIPVVVATTTPVERAGELEVLSCVAADVDLSRAPLPLLIAHNDGRLAVGLVDGLVATGTELRGFAVFGTSDEAQQIERDVRAGIHRSVSVGYTHTGIVTREAETTTYRWQPYEASIVPVPADPAAGFFRSKDRTMTQTTETERTDRAEEILELCTRHGLANQALDLIRRCKTVDAAKDEIINILAVRDAASGGHHNTAPERGRATHAERQLIVDSLAARMGLRQTERPVIRNTDAAGLAARALELQGVRVDPSWNRSQVVERAFAGRHGTTDFPMLLADAVGRVLHAGYDTVPAALKAVARQVNARDFRARSVIRIGSAPSLEPVNEHGEFTYGTIDEGAATWRLATFGRIFALTRQAIVNDDLEGFAELVRKFGEAAARREADELVALLTGTPQIDGGDLFDGARSTKITHQLTAKGIGLAVAALRAQKEIGGQLVAHEPGALLVPTALEMTARQLVATINPPRAADVQPFTLSVVVEPRLASAAEWYLTATNQAAMEYGYLEGEEGVQVTTREGFEVDGLEMKARLDFGCGWASPLGWVKSTGVTGDGE